MSTDCDNCGGSARFRRDEKLLCETCYQARVPSWSRLAADRLDGAGADPEADEPAQESRTWLLFNIGKRLVPALIATIIFVVVAIRATLDSDWADAAVSWPIALLLAVVTRKLWRQWRVASGKCEDSD